MMRVARGRMDASRHGASPPTDAHIQVWKEPSIAIRADDSAEAPMLRVDLTEAVPQMDAASLRVMGSTRTAGAT